MVSSYGKSNQKKSPRNLGVEIMRSSASRYVLDPIWLVAWLPFFIFPSILGFDYHPNWLIIIHTVVHHFDHLFPQHFPRWRGGERAHQPAMKSHQIHVMLPFRRRWIRTRRMTSCRLSKRSLAVRSWGLKKSHPAICMYILHIIHNILYILYIDIYIYIL